MKTEIEIRFFPPFPFIFIPILHDLSSLPREQLDRVYRYDAPSTTAAMNEWRAGEGALRSDGAQWPAGRSTCPGTGHCAATPCLLVSNQPGSSSPGRGRRVRACVRWPGPATLRCDCSPVTMLHWRHRKGYSANKSSATEDRFLRPVQYQYPPYPSRDGWT